MKVLRLILGDQLNQQHSWYDEVSDDVHYIMMEVRQETDYAHHHIQKIVLFFSGMRAHATFLEQAGHRVHYMRLDDSDNTQSIPDNVKNYIEKHHIEKFDYQLPDEYRLDDQLRSFSDSLDIPTEAYDTEHFYTTRNELKSFFGSKSFLLERFYRNLRQKHDILMDGDEPLTGKWNYDHENRKKIPASHNIPAAKVYDYDVTDIVEMLDKHGVKYLGSVDADSFIWPVTREDYVCMLRYFCNELLPYFGTYQDAMVKRSWTSYHSRLSFGMNAKIISPKEVVQTVIDVFEKRPDRFGIAQVEGFIRQILGWREYMRGIYWAHMPDYAEKNYFDHQNKLPHYYWSADTKMNCIKHCVQQSLDYGYAHHIQRLMVTGNFALLAGIHPDEVDDWYLGVYIDAIEWVEITNTRGMSQHADGGIVGSKPYISSANYIHKMSDYCKDCHYNHKSKTGDASCPFNSMYWHFLDRHQEKLVKNPRMSMMYRVWNKYDVSDQKAILKQADYYLEHLEEL